MTQIGTPLSPGAKRVMLLGSGELGKEVIIELQRYGVECIAVDRYPHAPAMQVAHRSHVINMLDPAALRALVEQERPHLIVPEIEAIATTELIQLEEEGFTVIPTAKAAWTTMNREGIRRLAAEELGLKTSAYRFASTWEEYETALTEIGYPAVVKPVMSSSGKGQSLIKGPTEAKAAWELAFTAGRGKAEKVIVEDFIAFDFEITLLTIRHVDGVTFCPPIGHRQVKGDYHESWQPQFMTPKALARAQAIGHEVTSALGGYGLFGVELFVQGEDVFFSEVSPRPHDTGMVTLISQDLSEFALHVRAILGLPIPKIRQWGPAASAVILVEGDSQNVSFGNLNQALAQPDTQIRLFGKPQVQGERRMGVALALGKDISEARAKAQATASAVKVVL